MLDNLIKILNNAHRCTFHLYKTLLNSYIFKRVPIVIITILVHLYYQHKYSISLLQQYTGNK